MIMVASITVTLANDVYTELNLDIFAESDNGFSAIDINRTDNITLRYILKNTENNPQATTEDIEIDINIPNIFYIPKNDLCLTSHDNKKRDGELMLFLIAPETCTDLKLNLFQNGVMQFRCDKLPRDTSITLGYITQIRRESAIGRHENIHKNRVNSNFTNPPYNIKYNLINDINFINIHNNKPSVSPDINISSFYILNKTNSSITVPIWTMVAINCVGWDKDNSLDSLNCYLYDNFTNKSYKMDFDPMSKLFATTIAFDKAGTHDFLVNISDETQEYSIVIPNKTCIVKDFKESRSFEYHKYKYICILIIMWVFIKLILYKFLKFGRSLNVYMFLPFGILSVVYILKNPYSDFGVLGKWMVPLEYVFILTSFIISDFIIYKWRFMSYVNYKKEKYRIIYIPALVLISLLFIDFTIFNVYIFPKDNYDFIIYIIAILVSLFTLEPIRSFDQNKLQNPDDKDIIKYTLIVTILFIAAALFVLTAIDFYTISPSMDHLTFIHLLAIIILTELPLVTLILVPGIIFNNRNIIIRYIIQIIEVFVFIIDHLDIFRK